MLACLLVRVNERVGFTTLAEEIWGGSPPSSARANIRTYANNLRQLLHLSDEQMPTAVDGGYVLRLSPDQIDIHTCHELVTAGRAALAKGDYELALSRLSRGTELSRGPALLDVATGPLLSWHAATIDAELAEAAEGRAAALLQLNRPTEALALLRRHVAFHPLRENAHALLMIALYRAGDPAAALEAFQQARSLLREQLGIDPGPELHRIQEAVLMRDPALGALSAPPPMTIAVTATGSAPVPQPRQVPPAAAVLLGRQQQLAELRRVTGRSPTPGRPAIAVIHGPGGVGKSAMAIHFAHDVAEDYPDGQLYLDLQGATPGMAPLDPMAALTRLLTSLGVPPAQMSNDLAAAAVQFRTLTAGRRILILLDNVADTHQMVALLPASDTGLVLLTSRSMLAALDGAAHVHLRPLGVTWSIRLLAALAGRHRVAAEPAAAAEVARLCGYLPLPLKVVGARLAAHPALRLDQLAARLADERQRLDLLELPALSVRACLRTGYQQLRDSPSSADNLAARAFRLMAVLAVPEFGTEAVSALLGLPTGPAEAALERAAELHLVEPLGPGRWRIHDLLRLVGSELAASDEPALNVRAAVCRAIDFYIASARRATSIIRPGALPEPADPRLTAPAHAAAMADAAAAVAWLEEELLVLLVLARNHPGEAGLGLLRALNPYLAPRAHWAVLGELAELANDAAAIAGDIAGEAFARTSLGIACLRRSSHETALTHLSAALELRQRINDPDEATTLQCLGLAFYELNQFAASVACNARAFRLQRDAGRVALMAISLHNLGEAYAALGRLPAAERFLRRSLLLRDAAGDRFGAARGHVTLGRICASRGDVEEGMHWLKLGTALAGEVGYGEAEWEGHLYLSEMALRSGDLDGAQDELHRAQELCEGLARQYLRAVVLRQLSRVHQTAGRDLLARSSAAAAEEILATCTTGRDPALEMFLAGPSTWSAAP